MMKVTKGAILIAASTVAAYPASQKSEPLSRLPELQLPIPPLRAVPFPLKLMELAPVEGAKRLPSIPLFCGSDNLFTPEEQAPLGLIELFGSAEAFRLVLSSDSVEIVELKPRTVFHTPAIEYPDRRAKLPLADAIALRSVVCSDASFDWRSQPKPESGASFRIKFAKDGRTVSLDLFTSLRSVRAFDDRNPLALLSIEFGFPIAAEIIERYFPGAIPKS